MNYNITHTQEFLTRYFFRSVAIIICRFLKIIDNCENLKNKTEFENLLKILRIHQKYSMADRAEF